ncbi:vitellogenin-like [Podarcis lilfordi]|uniref:Vitellogenin-like n=1 Tax=Podarcis lilfordi TaxID=74358 RepID=A0AA35LA70_9SAUR|nr:vitellogenin-like [Podarcis lilfordi]
MKSPVSLNVLLQDVQIKTTAGSKDRLHKENGSLREALEQHPLWFCYHNGKILKIFPKGSEPIWALNIKRGILSALQTSLVATTNGSVEEVDVLGKCPTRYQQKGPLLLKTKDLNLCSHRFSGMTSLRSIALPNAPPDQQLISSKLECVQKFEEGILAESQCIESHLTTSPGRKGSGVKTQTRMAMKLFRTEAEITAHERVDTKDIYESSLLYEREKTARWLGKEDEVVVVSKILQKLCMNPRADSESANLFMALVFELRLLSAGALLSLWQGSSSKCQGNWQPLVDALPSCATEACVVLMKEMIVSEEVDEDKMESFLWSLSFIPEPTAGTIDALAGELILKAIGNAGLAAARLVPVLSSCAMLKSNPTEIRLAAIEAFRRVPCAANHATLVRLYQAYNEDVEIRIASYLMAMKCPSEQLFHQVKWTLQEEKSSQVGSFVWRHLSELLETDDPLKQHLKNSLPNDIIDKEFEGETWKFSSYSDVTFHSAAASTNIEAQLIFSPESFIPRSIAMNLTIHALGRAINLLEASSPPKHTDS